MKAFVVTADHVEGAVLVFAKFASRAKQLAHGTDFLSDADWVDLRCRREPKADRFAGDSEMAIHAQSLEEQRILRDLGWYQLEGCLDVCSKCELHEWDDLPESILQEVNEDEHVCTGCIEASKQ